MAKKVLSHNFTGSFNGAKTAQFNVNADDGNLAIILGGAVYIGKWQKEAIAFLQANENTLAKRQVWLFSSGPTGTGDPVELLEGQRLPAAMQPIVERIQPLDIAVFHGYINPNKLNFIEKWAIKSLVEKPMGDFRDWNRITGWASTIADTLKQA